MSIEDFLQEINKVSSKYGLDILSLDYTDVTVLCRVGFSFDVFIQVYLNSTKEKLNLALIIGKNRIYGVDKEGGIYHKHPVENSQLHLSLEKEVSLEEFIIESMNILIKLGIL